MDDLLKLITDIAQNGIVCVDREGDITLFNRKAMEIIGASWSGARAHPAGMVLPGDIVLIADNVLGDDDGGLTPQDLAVLNIHDADLKSGDALVAAGVYKNNALDPVYRFSSQSAMPAQLTLAQNYLGLDLTLSVDSGSKELMIRVGRAEYPMAFYRSLGNMVVVEGSTGAVKFFQGRGSTLRREDIRDLLQGRPFTAKGDGSSDLDLIGSNFFSVFLPGAITSKLSEILSGHAPAIAQESYELNQRLMLTSIRPILRGGEIDGAVLELTDLSETGTLLRERNELIALVEQVNLGQAPQSAHVPPDAFSSFAGSSAPIQRVKYLAYRAAQSPCNVIITGESGTGKSQLAKEIHQLARPHGPFVEVNCSSIPHDLFESELFGYVGGAFTGALSGGKPGYFEQAEGGTLFLDELAELPSNIQVKLLYVIQNKRFYRVGATKPTDVDVRILCATNKELGEEVRCGRFREDLFYRVNVFPIDIPPLRARISDLYLLSTSITEHTCEAYHLPPKQLSGKALEKLLRYDWPGNIRELGNVIERAITITDGPIIYPDAIQPELSGHTQPRLPEALYAQGSPDDHRPLRQILAEVEARALRAALVRFGGDKQQAMAALGLKKTTFYEKLQIYQIES